MLKTNRAKAIANAGRGRYLRNKRIPLSIKNAMLSRRVNILHQDDPVLKADENGAVVLDYNNPEHLRWLED